MYKIIGSDGKEYGPISGEQLRQWIAQGRVNRQTRIKPDTAAEWQSLDSLPEFAAEFANPTVTPPPPAGATPVPAKTSGLAITSLVLGILGLFTCGVTALVGLILGIVALVKIKNSQGRLSGNGLAIGGIATSAIFLLLVPIGAAMLLPALAQAKARAQQVHCVNNAKQLCLAVRMYASDNNDHLPATTNWCDAIQPYVGTPKVFQCSADSQPRSAFAYNRKLDGLKEVNINPQTVLLFESSTGWNEAGGPEIFSPHKHSKTTIVVGFADGSVQRLPRSQLDSLRWEP